MEQQQQSQERLQMWLDCDPGHDDMLAIILAACHPSINLLGISTSAGNSTIDYTTQNTLNILHLIHKNDIEVIRGSSKPMFGKLQTGEETHGFNGLEGAELDVSPKQAITSEPYIQIYNRIMKATQKVFFVNTGSMTNLALLLLAFPQVKQKIHTISLMCGAIGFGNWTPAAEFNVLLDPVAASIVFGCGIPIIMVPLEVTHTALITQSIFECFLKAKALKLGTTLVALNRKFQKNYLETQNFKFPPAHDPCAVFYLLDRTAFVGRNVFFLLEQAFVHIDIFPGSYGRTNCNFRGKSPNAFVCETMDVQKFWSVMLSVIDSIN